jgi:hypothetical protein
MLAIVDTYMAEALAIEVDTSLSGQCVARVLDCVISACVARSSTLSWTTARELTSGAFDQWTYARGVRLRSSSRASRCRTPSSRASTVSCATNA